MARRRDVTDAYRVAETALLSMLADRLRQGLTSPTWMVDRLTEVPAVRRNTQLIINDLDRGVRPQAVSAVTAAYTAAAARTVATIGAGTAMEAAGTAFATTVLSELQLIRLRLVATVVGIYRRVIAMATARAGLGMSLDAAVQQAWQQAADRGVTGFVDRAGRRWSLGSYVDMLMRTAVTQARTQAVVDVMTAAGMRLVYVPYTGSRHTVCARWERRVLALWGETGRVNEIGPDGRRYRLRVAGTLADARADGLLHPRCEHAPLPYLPGVTRIPSGTRRARSSDQQVTARRELRRWQIRLNTAITRDAQRVARVRVAVLRARATR